MDVKLSLVAALKGFLLLRERPTFPSLFMCIFLFRSPGAGVVCCVESHRIPTSNQ